MLTLPIQDVPCFFMYSVKIYISNWSGEHTTTIPNFLGPPSSDVAYNIWSGWVVNTRQVVTVMKARKVPW